MSQADQIRARRLQGKHAGLVSRLLADVIDLLVVVALAFVVIFVVACFNFVFSGDFGLGQPNIELRGPLALILLVVYLAFGWGTTGRTAGKYVVGLSVVRADGGDLSLIRALVRAIISVLFIPGLFWSLVSRRSASVQDLILDTAVLHDWDLPVPPRMGAPRSPAPTGGG